MQLKHRLRDQKKQRKFYSGKRKRHTIKTQIVVEKEGKKIVCTSFSNGKRQDFRLFKESKVKILQNIKILADRGYRGLQKIHANVKLPHRKMKKHPLTKEKRQEIKSLQVKEL